MDFAHSLAISSKMEWEFPLHFSISNGVGIPTPFDMLKWSGNSHSILEEMSREYAEPAFAELHGSMNHLIEQLIDLLII